MPHHFHSHREAVLAGLVWCPLVAVPYWSDDRDIEKYTKLTKQHVNRKTPISRWKPSSVTIKRIQQARPSKFSHRHSQRHFVK